MHRTTINKRKYRARHAASGLCANCSHPVVPGRSRCQYHLDMFSSFRRRKEKRLIEEGLCKECGRCAIENAVNICTKCYVKRVSLTHLGTTFRAETLWDIYRQQGGKCAYTGIELSLGHNADLDHIVPLAAGGKSEPENLQWVLSTANKMKRDLLDQDFLELVKKIHEYRNDPE